MMGILKRTGKNKTRAKTTTKKTEKKMSSIIKLLKGINFFCALKALLFGVDRSSQKLYPRPTLFGDPAVPLLRSFVSPLPFFH